MENNRVKLIMETMWNTEWQGAERDTGLLQSAILGLCAIGKITKEEAVYARDTLEAELPHMGKEMKNSAAEAEEPYATVIQQAAEYLHDFWSELIDALPVEAE